MPHLGPITTILAATTVAIVSASSQVFTVSQTACQRYDSCVVAWLMQFGTP